MLSTNGSAAKRRGYTVNIRVHPSFLTEEKARQLQQRIDAVVERFGAQHKEIEMRQPKQPPEMPPVESKVVYRYKTEKGELRELTIKIWRCKYPVTQRKKCPTKIQGPNVGPVQHSANQHWANHLAEASK